ncbi:MAG: flagellar hook-length control protein FliK [Burkholderiales bacterium]
MDANQFFTVANQSASSWDALAQGNPAVSVPPAKTGFADLFNGQMMGQLRQDLAAPASAQVDLQLVSIGPKMNLITTAAPLPDLNSLASFARAQGLDEEAVRTLFGSTVAEAAPGPTELTGKNPPQAVVDSTLTLADLLGRAPEPKSAAVPSTVSSLSALTGLAGSILEPAPVAVPSTAGALAAPLDLPPMPQAGALPAGLQRAQVSALPSVPPSAGKGGVLPSKLPESSASLNATEVALNLAPTAQANGRPAQASVAPKVSTQPDTQADSLAQAQEQSAAEESIRIALGLAAALGMVAPPLSQAEVSPAPVKPNVADQGAPVALNSVGTVNTSRAQATELPTAPAPIPLAKPVDPLVASLVSMQIDAQSQPVVKPSSTVVTDPVSASSDEVMQVAMRVRMDVQSQEITRRLALMSGSSQKARWSAISSVASSTDLAHTTLDKPWETLTIDAPSTLLESVESGFISPASDTNGAGVAFNTVPAESGKPAALNPATGSGAEPLSERDLATQRSAQYQQLADRVGQALGERMLSQIERGEWKLELRLKPEALGRIDVALAMHAGALDASFSSDNGMTRDLILQGAVRLKDALAQSGMSVANVWVGGDQTSKRDGNPTPGRSFKGSSGASRSDEGEVVSGVNSLGSTSTASDGLDVLA